MPSLKAGFAIPFPGMGKLLPLHMGGPCEEEQSQEQLLPEELVGPCLRAAAV